MRFKKNPTTRAKQGSRCRDALQFKVLTISEHMIKKSMGSEVRKSMPIDCQSLI